MIDAMAKSLQACINTRAYDNNAQYPSAAEMNKGEQPESSPMAADVKRSEHLPMGQGDTLPFPMQAFTSDQRQHSGSSQAQED